MLRRRAVLFVLSAGMIFIATSALAQSAGQPMWPGDVAIATRPSDQGVGNADGPGVAVVSDNQGGAFIVWEDQYYGTIMAQRVDAAGQPQWLAGGIPVAYTGYLQLSPRAVSDGAGGLIVVWIDSRPPSHGCNLGYKADCQIAVQRLDVNGNPLWGKTGKLVGLSNFAIGYSAIAATEEGGVAFAWESASPTASCCVFYAQAISATGEPRWGDPARGLQISPDPQHVIGISGQPITVVTDGANGAFVMYFFYQVDIATESGYTALQHVGADGKLKFPVAGLQVTAGTAYSRAHGMVADDAGGAILVLGLYDRAANSDDLVVQRVDGNGTPLWGANGVTLVTAPGFQEYPHIIRAGAGNWIVAWADERNNAYASCYSLTGNCDVYAQKIDATGKSLWQANGVPVTNAPGNQNFPLLTSDGAGGAIIVFEDCRYGNYSPEGCDFGRDLFGQRLDASGNRLWTSDGVAVSKAGWNQGLNYGTQFVPSIGIASDQNHGAIVAWPDGRTWPCPISVGYRECDVYAQRISDVGVVLPPNVDLAVTGIITPPKTALYSPQQYVAEVRNIGTSTAHGVSLHITLSGGLDTYTPIPSAGGCISAGYLNYLCEFGDLQPAASAHATMFLRNRNPGHYTNTAEAHATEAESVTSNNTATATSDVSYNSIAASGQTGWWWNPAEPGRGYFIEQQNNDVFFAAYYYAEDGRATWSVANGTIAGSTFYGTLQTFANGQTLRGAYKPNTSTGSPGTVTIVFQDTKHATMTWPGGVVPLERFSFSPSGVPSYTIDRNGWWWNPDQAGRGFSIEFQGTTFFMVGFMYDDAGNPIWYLAMGETSNYGYTFEGQWTQYGNGQTLTGPFKSNGLVNPNVGRMNFQFVGGDNFAVLTLPDGSQVPLTHFAF